MGTSTNAAANALATNFTSTDRSTSALAQMSMRDLVAQPCGDASIDQSVFSTKDILLPGETLPAQPEVALAFAAARNVWLYPYTADSSEVQRLARLYLSQKAAPSCSILLMDGKTIKADATGERCGRQSVCMATLLAPQFWIGNPQQDDALRRISRSK